MAFAITPVVPAAPREGLQGNRLQIRGEGSNLGDANVRVIDFISDPTEVTVTRGWGENRHIITIRSPPIGGSVGGGGGQLKKPGWMTDINDPDSTPLHANNGSGELFFEDVGPLIGSTIYAGIEGYTGQVVTWDWDWVFVPFQGESTSHPPVVVELSGGRVSVTYAYDDEAYDENGSTSGILTLTATVDDVVLVQTIEVATGAGLYTPIAWQPTP